MKILTGIALFSMLGIAACGGEGATNSANSSESNTETIAKEEASNDKGIGKFTAVELITPLDQKMVEACKGVYDLKCGSCHRLNEEKLVGLGWKGVTSRRKPEWIMNFATNAEEMLAKDAAAISMLEECLIRMPNQNLSDDDARHVLEFMRNNDGVK